MSHYPPALDPLVEFWSVRAPELLDPWAPPLADAFADGVWMTAWRRVAGFAPLAAFGIGLLFPLLWPGMRDVYTESLIFLILIFTASILSGTAGAMLCIGYILGDLAGGPSGYYSYSGLSLAARFGGMMVTWMLLGIATVVIPQLARRMSEEIASRVREESSLRLPLQIALYAVATGLLVFLWCQAMIVLVRPVFTWAGNQPTTEAVEEVQTRWVWIAGFAVLAAVARMALEHWARTRSSSAALIEELERRRWSTPGKRGTYWKRVPLVLRVIVSAAVVTLLLAGTFSNAFDAIALFAVLGLITALRAGLFGRLPDGWARTMNRIPVLVRFILAPAIGFVLANVPLRLFWRFGSLRPVMAGALITVIIFYVLFPGMSATPKRANRRAIA